MGESWEPEQRWARLRRLLQVGQSTPKNQKGHTVNPWWDVLNWLRSWHQNDTEHDFHLALQYADEHLEHWRGLDRELDFNAYSAPDCTWPLYRRLKAVQPHIWGRKQWDPTRQKQLDTLLKEGNTDFSHIVDLALDQVPEDPALYTSAFSNLKRLTIHNNQGLTSLHPFHGFTGLQQLTLMRCHSLTQLEGVASESLKGLTLRECDNLQTLGGLGSLPQLQSLVINPCHQIASLAPIGALKGLEKLAIRGCQQKDLNFLRKLPALKVLYVSNAPGVEDFASISELKELEELHLSACDQLRDLSFLGDTHIALKKIEVSDCPRFSSLQPSGPLPAASTMLLRGLRELENLEGLECYESLTFLGLHEARHVASLTPLASLRNLSALHLNKFPSVTELSPLFSLDQLERLTLEAFSKVSTFDHEERSLPDVKELTIREFPQLSKLEGLAMMGALEELRLESCPKLNDLVPLSPLDALKTLFVLQCEGVETLKGLHHLKSLRFLNVSGCSSLTDITAIAALSGLRTLILENNQALDAIDALRHLSGLETLSLRFNRGLEGNTPWLHNNQDIQAFLESL